MSIQLTQERKTQLRRAHKALDNGDYGLAAAHFAEDLDGFMARLKVVMAKVDKPLRGQVRGKYRPKPPAPPTAFRREREQKHAQIRKILEAIPNTNVQRLAMQIGVDATTVYRIKNDMGIPPAPNGRGLREKIIDLLAEKPQITNREAARILECSRDYVSQVRREDGR